MKLPFFLALTAIVCSTFVEAGRDYRNGRDCDVHSDCRSNLCQYGKCSSCAYDWECGCNDWDCNDNVNCLDGKCIDAECLHDRHCPWGHYCFNGECLEHMNPLDNF